MKVILTCCLRGPGAVSELRHFHRPIELPAAPFPGLELNWWVGNNEGIAEIATVLYDLDLGIYVADCRESEPLCPADLKEEAKAMRRAGWCKGEPDWEALEHKGGLEI